MSAGYIEIVEQMRAETVQLAEQSRAKAALLVHDKLDIVSIMERSGARCRCQNDYVYEFEYDDLEVTLIRQNTSRPPPRMLVTAHRPIEQSEREGFERELKRSPDWYRRFEYASRFFEGWVPDTALEVLKWLGKDNVARETP